MRPTERFARAKQVALRPCAMLLALLHVAPADSIGQTPAAGVLMGKAVVPKHRTFMMRESNQPGPPRAGIPAIYHVKAERGRSLLIFTPGLSGWVSRDEVVPIEQANGHFTNQIRSNPRDS